MVPGRSYTLTSTIKHAQGMSLMEDCMGLLSLYWNTPGVWGDNKPLSLKVGDTIRAMAWDTDIGTKYRMIIELPSGETAFLTNTSHRYFRLVRPD